MAGLKEVFVFIAGVALLVQAFFLLRIAPGIQSTDNYTSRDTSLRSMIMAINVSHVEGRHHSSEHDATGVPLMAKDLVKRSQVTIADVSDNKGLLPKMTERGQCSYKVQVYDKGDKLKYAPVLKSIVRQSQGGPHVQADIPCSNNCSIQVTIADDKNKFAGMDAVIFHFMKKLIPNPLPPATMNPNQTWMYFTWESPRSNAQEGGGVGRLPVHATWTYHRTSHITTPYGFYKPGIPMADRAKSVGEWLKGKTKLVAWMASNCAGTFWPRTGFVKKLKKYIQVDAYGACGNLKCMPAWSPKCTVDLMRQYKFYLSLENAECDDYITEKLWNKPLMQGVVPIVYGPRRKVYEELLPPNSFIYIGDYKNMNELADYLKLLDSKPELYVQYLEWQYKGSVGVHKQMHDTYDPSIFCNLIPVIERVKRGELKRTPVVKSTFSQSCRKPNKGRNRTASAFRIGTWNPW